MASDTVLSWFSEPECISISAHRELLRGSPQEVSPLSGQQQPHSAGINEHLLHHQTTAKEKYLWFPNWLLPITWHCLPPGLSPHSIPVMLAGSPCYCSPLPWDPLSRQWEGPDTQPTFRKRAHFSFPTWAVSSTFDPFPEGCRSTVSHLPSKVLSHEALTHNAPPWNLPEPAVSGQCLGRLPSGSWENNRPAKKMGFHPKKAEWRTVVWGLHMVTEKALNWETTTRSKQQHQASQMSASLWGRKQEEKRQLQEGSQSGQAHDCKASKQMGFELLLEQISK